MHTLIFFVPDSHLEQTKQAVFDAGAGTFGHYKQVCFQMKGVGQFMPLPGSHPHTGQRNALQQLTEWRVELLCPESKIAHVIKALLNAHPYEKPAISHYPVHAIL